MGDAESGAGGGGARGRPGRAGGASGRTAAVYSPSNALTGLTVGGTTHTFGYAGLGNTERLTTDTTTYANTPLGISGHTTGTASTYTTREPNGTLVSYRPGPGTTATNYYYLFDRQGSVLAAVDNTGTPQATYSYDPYGNTRTRTGPLDQPYQYTGGHHDQTTGLYKLGARYYDPTLGRFTQPDPAGQEANPYLYAQASPCNYTDPTGRSILGDVAATAGLLSDCSEGAAFGISAVALAGLLFGPVTAGASLLAATSVSGVLVSATYGCGVAIISGNELGYNVFSNQL